MIELQTRVRLAPKARLRFDARSGKQMLLYPERGLELSETAARIVSLCGEERTVTEIVAALVGASAGELRERIEADVLAFLRALEDRSLLVLNGGGP